MQKEKLFEKIRSEDVVIWAGAGLSISSGFPSGYKLKEMIYDSLTPMLKQHIGLERSLMDFCEAVVDLNGNRNHLITQLRKIFLTAPPTPSDVHQKIAQIPHFRYIFTTNYDRLIEQAMTNATPITKENQIAYLENDGQTKIFKMHGDFSDPDSIVITTSDYNNMYVNGTLNNLIWNQAKAILATKTVLFLGYGVEDTNVLVLLDSISSALGNNRKEFYLVAPGMDELRKIQLDKRNIKYIDSTAETLIDELLNNIKANITFDLHSKKVSAETLGKFMENFECSPVLQSNGGNFEIVEIKTKAPAVMVGNIDILDKTKQAEFSSHLEENPLKPFVLKAKDLKPVIFSFSGILLDIMHSAEQIEITRMPTNQGFVEITFADGTEFQTYGSLFTGKLGLVINLKFTAGEITVKLNKKNEGILVNMESNHNNKCMDVRTEIEYFSFLTSVISGNSFTITTESGKIHNFSNGYKFEDLSEFKDMLEYFNDLKRIETFYQIKFKDFTIWQARKSKKKKDVLMALISEEELPLPLIGNVEIRSDNPLAPEIVSLFKVPGKKEYFECIINDNETFDLHGHQFDVGRKEITIEDAVCINIEDVQNGGNTLIIKSENSAGKIRYGKSEVMKT
ncbi:SIR2 family protein [Sphingobacterium sp.]|uniref:SIR2 family NAD-dependent protein deacylase n=1 Tax=Sphingobacterium sp. TaxID=341027 RepID=UPI0031E01382